MKTSPFTLVSALALALASSCGEFRRGPYEPPPDGSIDSAFAVCGAYLGGPCNPYTQTGCEGGQACVMVLRPTGELITYCADPGGGAFGSACATPEACAAGLVCVSNQCRRLCCPGETEPCSTAITTVPAVCDLDIGLSRANVMACRIPCDWRAPSCPPNTTCVPDRDGVTDCVAAGEAPEGAACSRISDCTSGSLCIGRQTGPECRSICDTTFVFCAGGETCLPVDDRPAPFGVCIP